VIELEAMAPNDADSPVKAKALIDTGASITCVPQTLINQIGRAKLVATVKKVRGAFGDHKTNTERESYVLDIRLDKCHFRGIEVVVLSPDREYALIGRDILNGYSVTFDGPNSLWQVDAKCK
jgi:predicted aspartyl protease